MKWFGVLLAIAVSATSIGPAAAGPTTRTAPYDVGCIDHPPCEAGWDRAREGEMEAVPYPSAYTTYSMPPLVIPVIATLTTTTGVWVRSTRAFTLTATVTVRDDAAFRPTLSSARIGPWICLNLLSPSGGRYRDAGCQQILAGGRTTTASSRFGSHQPPGRYLLYASLISGPVSVTVESFSYTVTAA